MLSRFEYGIELLNERRYYEAHDILEEVWRDTRNDSRSFYQGVVQVAIAMYHFSTGNLAGAQSVLLKSCNNLAGYPARGFGIDIGDLRRQLDLWRQAMKDGGPYPPPVHIDLVAGC